MTRSQTDPEAGRGTAVLVAIGGFDPGCGAGLARDILTAHDLGAAVVAVATCWTDQDSRGVGRIEPRPPDAVRRSIDDAIAAARRAGNPAVKVGMLANHAIAAAVEETLRDFAGPIVVDPVLAATRGGALWDGPATGLLPLLRQATVATPNTLEAAALSGMAVETADDSLVAAEALVSGGIPAVLVKGGHLSGDAVDVLATASRTFRMASPRFPAGSPRGTGCALASAIAIELGRGRSLPDAVSAARAWLAGRIAAAVEVGGERHLP